MPISTTYLVWLQFSYAIWQFLRVAKFFRIPSSFLYHTLLWLARRPGYGKPFAPATFSLVLQGEKWTYPTSDISTQLKSEDASLGGGHFIQKRNGSRYVVDYESVSSSYILERHGTQILCSSVDMLLPKFYIADVYSWSEGFDKFMSPGANLETFNASKALFMSSREHFLNQNFMRFLSILPLVLRSKGFDKLSAYASLVIIALDQLSYPANLLWLAFKDVLVWCTRSMISKISDPKTRKFISTFLSTVTDKLRYSDNVFRNFYFVDKNEEILVFGTSCADYFHDHMRVADAPSELNEFMTLEKDVYDSLSLIHGDMEHGMGIKIGDSYLEHSVNGACIHSFFVNNNGFYNFIDYEHLHFGVYKEEQLPRFRMALKWIENYGKMPLTCDNRGGFKAVKFNQFTQTVALGYSPICARTRRSNWVQ